MEINRMQAPIYQNFNTTAAKSSNVSFRGNASETFDKYQSQKLPENKAIQVVTKLGPSSLLSLLTYPTFGLIHVAAHTDYKLVDIDPDNLTTKQEKMIKKGKLLNQVPAGYHIEDNKVVKNK